MDEATVTISEERLRARESALRMALARLLDAAERYPDDLVVARAVAVGELRRTPLWVDATEGNQI